MKISTIFCDALFTKEAQITRTLKQFGGIGLFLFVCQISYSQPDLTFSVNPTIDSNTTVPSTGATLDFHYTERNQRNAAAGAHTNRYYLSSDTTIGNDTEILPSYSSPGLGRRASDAISASVSFSISPGVYYLVVKLDADGDVSERSETNNDYILTSTPVTVIIPPTITPTFTPSPTYTPSPTFTPSPTSPPHSNANSRHERAGFNTVGRTFHHKRNHFSQQRRESIVELHRDQQRDRIVFIFRPRGSAYKPSVFIIRRRRRKWRRHSVESG